LLYISCNPVTLARDLEKLINSKLFKLKIIQPLDMFPHTHHMESISFLK
jgi:tRNA/tmRNA/rRNA uracil-C5-methylase (TrmA/RlmC/RlmD family)